MRCLMRYSTGVGSTRVVETVLECLREGGHVIFMNDAVEALAFELLGQSSR